jgi:hypothetical protein
VLAGRLREGARTLLASELGRLPTDEEVARAKPLLGSARQPGWEDVLWVLFMNHEFQFIR